jgi:hypothetical protein
MSNNTFTRRARVTKTPISTQRRYDSTDGPWAVIEVRGIYGRYYLAVRKVPGGEYVVSQHRKRKPAEEALTRR